MRYKKTRKITHRVSSITNGFVQAILPDGAPDAAEHEKFLAFLQIDPKHLICAYCGDPANHWDHLNPFVRAKRPSGYFNEARNLVPACGPCNTSKSGSQWREWMFGRAKNSPRSRGVIDLELRAERLQKFEVESGLRRVDVEELVSPDLWDAYWRRQVEIEQLIFDAQKQAEVIKIELTKALERVSQSA